MPPDWKAAIKSLVGSRDKVLNPLSARLFGLWSRAWPSLRTPDAACLER